jgi:type I restriction enzyme M protein
MKATNDFVQKLWSLCNVLRDDGMVYHQYMTELTYLLFLKMAAETGTEQLLPENYRWSSLTAQKGDEQLSYYRKMLTHLGEDAPNPVVRSIFAFPTTVFKHAINLRTVVEGINDLHWYSAGRDGFGDVYEGLLEKNAVESKSGAGQYFTPRALIDSIISLVKPAPGEIVQDPAAGTGGFLVSADRYARLCPENRSPRGLKCQGVELVEDTYRLCLMNLFVHAIDAKLILGDTLDKTSEELDPADVIVTNPPFGAKKGGARPTRDDLRFRTGNKQLAFLQHVYNGLLPGGRAAVIIPDNVLFEEGVGAKIREDLMARCQLHTILRLPNGIFYAHGVKTNVLFFTRGTTDKNETAETWIYDLRTRMPSFGKRSPLTREHFTAFENAFGDDPHGRSPRSEKPHEGRFRRYTRDEIARRSYNLDITWLQDDSNGADKSLLEPEEIAEQIIAKLQDALAEMVELNMLLTATNSLVDA